MSDKILIVDDEPAIRQMVAFTLRGDGYDFVEAADADEASKAIRSEHIDLVLLDWMLPGISGVEFAKRLKRDPATRHLPIIMLTAKGEEQDKVRGLDTGADDYVTKPFSTKEMLARIRAVLRRSTTDEPSDVIEIDRLRVDSRSHRVTIDGAELGLSPTEFRLLHFFVTNPERVYSRSQLLDNVWGDNTYIEERTVDVHIRRLRKLLSPSGYDKCVQTVRSVGYRFSKSAA